jgi:hypothetical protein
LQITRPSLLPATRPARPLAGEEHDIEPGQVGEPTAIAPESEGARLERRAGIEPALAGWLPGVPAILNFLRIEGRVGIEPTPAGRKEKTPRLLYLEVTRLTPPATPL